MIDQKKHYRCCNGEKVEIETMEDMVKIINSEKEEFIFILEWKDEKDGDE